MFASLAPLALFALALSSSVSAAPVPKRNVEVRAAPSGWATEYLESYDVYHTRYVALSCQTQHDTTFFDECCHPLLATETLSGNRPAQCTPSTSSAAAAVETFAPSTTAAAAAPAATTSASEEECEVEDETSSAVATSTEEVASPSTTQEATTTTAAEVAAAVVAPTTTAAAVQTTEAAPTTTTAEAPAATTAAASSGSENTGGYATYFLQNGNAGACGNVNSDDTPLVAITSSWWGGGDNFSSTSDLCGKYVKITRPDTGASVTAIIADACPSCVNANSLDLSVGAFTAIATEAEGMVSIEWSLL